MAGETTAITIMAFVGLLLFSSLAIEGASAQQTNDPLVGVTTDKAFYNYGDSVTIFGVVRPVTSDTIHIEVQDPEGQVYDTFNVDVKVDANGSFRYTSSEIPYSLVPGTFLLTATYEGYTANNLFYVSDIYIPDASIDVNVDKAIFDPESRSLEVHYSWTVSGGIKVDSWDAELLTPDGTIITDMCQLLGPVRVMLYFPDGKMVTSHILESNGVSSCDADAQILTISGSGGMQDFSGKATMGIYTIKAYYGTASVTKQFVVVEDDLAEGWFDQDEEGNVHFVPYENENNNHKQLHIEFNMVERSDYILVRVENHEENNDPIESVIVKFVDEDGRTTLTPDIPIEPGDWEYFKLAKSPHPGEAETRRSGSLAVWSAYNAEGELLLQGFAEVV